MRPVVNNNFYLAGPVNWRSMVKKVTPGIYIPRSPGLYLGHLGGTCPSSLVRYSLNIADILTRSSLLTDLIICHALAGLRLVVF